MFFSVVVTMLYLTEQWPVLVSLYWIELPLQNNVSISLFKATADVFRYQSVSLIKIPRTLPTYIVSRYEKLAAKFCRQHHLACGCFCTRGLSTSIPGCRQLAHDTTTQQGFSFSYSTKGKCNLHFC